MRYAKKGDDVTLAAQFSAVFISGFVAGLMLVMVAGAKILNGIGNDKGDDDD